MRILFKVFVLLGISQTIQAGVIYGLDDLQGKARFVHYPIYVQLGSFSKIHKAERLRHRMLTKTHLPIAIKFSRGQYKVRIGPFPNLSSLKTFSETMGNNKPSALQSFQTSKKSLIEASKPILNTRSSSAALKTKLVPKSFSKRPLLKEATPPMPVPLCSHPELSLFLGGSHIPNTIKGQTLQLLPYEIGEYADGFSNQSSADAFTWGLEALYRFKFPASIQNYFFNSLGTGINFFQISNFHQTGKVLQFNLPEFENYNYRLKLKNIRVLANFDLDFQPIRQYLIPFVQGGVGGARTEVAYQSTPILPVLSSDFSLPNSASWSFAYQVGAGVKYLARNHLSLSFRYLYAHMDKVNSSLIGNTSLLAAPLEVRLNTHNFLFGISYLID